MHRVAPVCATLTLQLMVVSPVSSRSPGTESPERTHGPLESQVCCAAGTGRRQPSCRRPLSQSPRLCCRHPERCRSTAGAGQHTRPTVLSRAGTTPNSPRAIEYFPCGRECKTLRGRKVEGHSRQEPDAGEAHSPVRCPAGVDAPWRGHALPGGELSERQGVAVGPGIGSQRHGDAGPSVARGT